MKQNSHGFFPTQDTREYKMFVGGLSDKTSKNSLISYFSQYGDIVNAMIMTDKHKKSRGFGFVIFKHEDTLNAILTRPNHVLEGKIIECKYATPKEAEASKDGGELKDQQKKIFIGGLNSTTTEDTLMYYFSYFGKVEKVSILKDKSTGRARGFGFICFEDPQSVDYVLNYPQHIIQGKKVDCKRSFPKELEKKDIDSSNISMSSKSMDKGGKAQNKFNFNQYEQYQQHQQFQKQMNEQNFHNPNYQYYQYPQTQMQSNNPHVIQNNFYFQAYPNTTGQQQNIPQPLDKPKDYSEDYSISDFQNLSFQTNQNFHSKHDETMYFPNENELKQLLFDNQKEINEECQTYYPSPLHILKRPDSKPIVTKSINNYILDVNSKSRQENILSIKEYFRTDLSISKMTDIFNERIQNQKENYLNYKLNDPTASKFNSLNENLNDQYSAIQFNNKLYQEIESINSKKETLTGCRLPNFFNDMILSKSENKYKPY